MSEIAFSRTKSRSLLGTLTDFSLMAGLDFETAPQLSLDDIAVRLLEVPILPPDGAGPIDLTRGVFEHV